MHWLGHWLQYGELPRQFFVWISVGRLVGKAQVWGVDKEEGSFLPALGHMGIQETMNGKQKGQPVDGFKELRVLVFE
jgi:hypothetical protein